MQESIDYLVGSRLRQYRRLRGYSLIEFSAMLHRSKSAISKYERGEVSIDLRTLNEMARLLDIPLSALLLDEQEAVQVSSLFHLPTSEEDGPQQRLYVYMWSGRPKAYLSRQVLFLSAHTATLFGEVESEENYCTCKYCFAGEGRRSDLSYRVFLRNLTHENDLVILDFQLPLNNQAEVPGFFCTFSIGPHFPLATKAILSREPIRDEERLKKLLIFDREDFKTYRINDYVKAFFPMTIDMLNDFGNGARNLDGRSRLEEWFDIVEEKTKDYVNETEIPKRRNRVRK